VGKIITFYSYNGGSDKSMALANVATLLTRWGYRVLMIDWDLEAPGGIGHFFEGNITSETVPSQDGILDLLWSAKEPKGSEHQWEELVQKLELKLGDPPEGELELLSAGAWDSADYFKKLHTFDVREFYAGGGASFIERLREDWKAKYDFVLINCRSGITPFGSICTIQLPDIMMLLVECDEHDLEGGTRVAQRVTAVRRSMPFDRLELLVVPVPTRFDPEKSPEGYDYEQRWLARLELAVADFYKPWLPKDFAKQEMLKETLIPYYSEYRVDDERLPALYKRPQKPQISKAYENIAALLANNFNQANRLHEDRSGFLSEVWKNFSLKRVLKLHEEWVKTEHASGQRANLTGRDCSNQVLVHAQLAEGIFVNANFKSTNLLGANVIKANFSGADLEGANLKELKGAHANFNNASLNAAKLGKADLQFADFQSAKLIKADLSDADFYKARLKKAVLDGAIGLTVKQVKGADLSYARIPENLGEFRRMREVRSESRRTRIVFYVLAFLSLYSIFVLFNINDITLFENKNLGILGGGIPALWFVRIAPVALLVLYFLFLIRLQQLYDHIVELPANFTDGSTLNDRMSDWFNAAVAYPYLGGTQKDLGRTQNVPKKAPKWRPILTAFIRLLLPFTQVLFLLRGLPLWNTIPFLIQSLLVSITVALGWSYVQRGIETLQENNTGDHWLQAEVDEADAQMVA
jgi:uncharacterized protein YjbI with pentapeptide repeats